MKKKILLFSMFLLVIALNSGDSEAAITLNGSVQDDLSLTDQTNLTWVVAAGDAINYTEVEFAGPTGNTTYTLIGNITNETANQFDWSVNWNITGVAEDGNYTLRLTAYNSTTDQIDQAFANAVIVNDSVMSSSFIGTSPAAGATFETATMEVSTTEDAVGVTLFFGLNSFTMTGNASNTGWTYDITKTNLAERSYNDVKVVIDGYGADDDVSSAERAYIVKRKDSTGAGKYAMLAAAEQEMNEIQQADEGMKLGSTVSSQAKKEVTLPELKKTGIGIASGAAAGFAWGLMGGPVGAGIGATIGGVIGLIA